MIVGDEPMTSAAAMVSPIARPRPSITAPTMPPAECGITAPVIISHRVAPSASAPSRSVCGVVSMTSRAIEVMIGVIITARIKPGGDERAPGGGLAEDAAEHRPVAEPVVHVLEEADQLRGQEDDAPQAEHHRGHDGDQVGEA